MKKLTVGLLNDSFPPTIDGVANVTVNYAKIINEKYGAAVVATPYYPHVEDDYPFEVIRYPSTYIGQNVGYRAGYPFDPKVLRALEGRNIDVIHTHCPFVSTILARMLRSLTGAPIVFTYHTKFDVDLEKAIASDSLRRASIRFILSNINACDEVWVVSKGAGENLRGIGYHGDYIVMENGTDFDRRQATAEMVEHLRMKHHIAPDMPVFLFVGRMRWYKGIQLSLDGLKAAKEQGEKFRFILVGDGTDCAEIAAYIDTAGMRDDCILVGAVDDREILRGYYTMADLFLFPSTFDTNGIVVREAAACSLPSVMIKGSCAAEGVSDGETGFVIEETVAAMRDIVLYACKHRDRMQHIGRQASEQIYISWDEAVKRAYERYLIILKNNKHKTDDAATLTEALNAAVERIVDDVAATRDQIEHVFYDMRERMEHKLEQSKLSISKNTDEDEKKISHQRSEALRSTKTKWK